MHDLMLIIAGVALGLLLGLVWLNTQYRSPVRHAALQKRRNRPQSEIPTRAHCRDGILEGRDLDDDLIPTDELPLGERYGQEE